MVWEKKRKEGRERERGAYIYSIHYLTAVCCCWLDDSVLFDLNLLEAVGMGFCLHGFFYVYI